VLETGPQSFNVRPPSIIPCLSTGMRVVYRELDNVAATDCSILLLGETGVGRSALARRAHTRSPRSDYPYVVLSSASIPGEQFESELFEPVRRAYTGTGNDSSGIGEGAVSGSVLIEEIDRLSAAGQRVLMQCVEMSAMHRPGEKEAGRPSVRFLASAGPDFEREWQRAGFLDRLFFALGVVIIRVPPLRARAADTIPLARHFLSHYARTYGKLGSEFSQSAQEALSACVWPGNIDELRSTVERAALMSVGSLVTLDDLGMGTEPASRGRTAHKRRRETTQAKIEAALRTTQGNVTRAADALGIHRRKLQRLMRQFGIDRASF
jgi:DNA-binding NtrC family response regulator